jgi:hypothetical protein
MTLGGTGYRPSYCFNPSGQVILPGRLSIRLSKNTTITTGHEMLLEQHPGFDGPSDYDSLRRLLDRVDLGHVGVDIELSL